MMNLLHSEIVKLLSENGQMSAGKIMNKLNGFPLGMDISLNEVESALRQLEEAYAVECQWRLKESPIQSDPPGGTRNPPTDPGSN